MKLSEIAGKHNLVGEVQLVYKRKRKDIESPVLDTQEAVYDFLMKIWNQKTIELREEFVVLLLNTSKRCIGYSVMGVGTVKAVLCERSHIVSLALLANASAVIIAHNHPSGSLRPSKNDALMSSYVKTALYYHDIPLLDHLVVTRKGFASCTRNAAFNPELHHL
jgi:DNA repair protein RadC